MLHSGRWWLTAACLALGGIAWVVFRFKRIAAKRLAVAAEARRAKIIGQLERGEPLEAMLAVLTKSLEESCSGLRCTITLAGPVYSSEDYPIEEKPGAIFPIVDTSGSRVGELTVQSPTGTLTRDESKAVDGIRDLAAIIAEHRSMHSELEMVDGRDRLTGLANGSVLAGKLGRSIESGLPADAPALFIFDLDRFKQVNDRLGRGAGDIYLQQAAERIAKCFRSGDLVARIGADDFATLALGLNAAEAVRICRSVIDTFATPFVIEGFPIVGGVSIGVSAFPRGGRTPAELRFSADAALCDSKKAGGGRFTICSPEIRERAASTANAGRLIRQAFDDCRCDLYYQPQMTVSGGLFGMEALVRAREPEQRLNSGHSSIEAAEHGGMSAGVDAWVVPEALRQYAEWLGKGLNPVRIAVNVSQFTLSHTEVLDQIVSYLGTFGLGPEAIQIELTESAAALSDQTSLDTLWQLRSAGISVSLEVFGREYSSSGRLNGLPVDALKIDKPFVGRLTEPDGSTRLISAMIADGHTLRMKVIAGDIETEEQMWSLRRMGCDVMQGNHIAHPLNAIAAGEILSARQKTQGYST
jgi:diguanylate cyclase (GGDEF)-like protein